MTVPRKLPLIACLLVGFGLFGQDSKVLLSHYSGKDQEPTADPTSSFWKDVKGVVVVRSVLGEEVPTFRSEVRSRWTKDNVYFLAIAPYQELNLRPNPDTKKETYKLWEYDCFEVYLGADFEHINRYREFQMSPQSEFLDLDIDSTRDRPGWNDERLWDSGMKVKARIDEAKKLWYGEMRIPIVAVDKRPAKAGNEMRLNLYLQDGRVPNRRFIGWQPTGVWNPHHPDKFGALRLEDR